MSRTGLLALGIALSALPVSAQDGQVFFENGRTDWKVHLSPQAKKPEVYAARELRAALRKISGADFELAPGEAAPERRAIIVGGLDHPEVQARSADLKLAPGKVAQVAVYTLGGRLYLAGNQPRGARYAVYSFLQRELGVRWLWPGESGEFMPARASWTLPQLRFNHQPPFLYRGFHLCGDWRDNEVFREWMARNFINIHRHGHLRPEVERGFHLMNSGHNAVLPKGLFDQHPEYFARIDGKRYRSNICLSNREVDLLVAGGMRRFVRKYPFLDILNIFPVDNMDYCRCSQCARMDLSTAWFEFYNRSTDTLKDEFPELKLATVAYQGYRDVPQCRIRNAEFVEYCSHSRCNIHPFGREGCKLNEKTMAALRAWQTTGLPIGNYAYEFDTFTWKKNHAFCPFLSVIDDAIKTGRRLGHVSMITEVYLSPKRGPEVQVVNVQNRLPLYLYARLLWDPSQTMTGILSDWCRTAFSKAAEPMCDYYLSMDRAWTDMPVHTGILGDALTLAPHLFANGLEKRALAALSAAGQRLSGIGDRGARERTAAAIERERTLFKQWHDLYLLSKAGSRLISLPLLAREEDLAHSSSPPQKLGSTHPASVSLAWTRRAILVKWRCHDPTVKSAVELVLSSGLTGETWHFAVDPHGRRQDWRYSAVGVREDRWNPVWQAKAIMGTSVWEAQMRIPFASLGQTPNPNDTWQARFLRHRGGRQGPASGVFPDRGTALLLFTSVSRTSRGALLWWSGHPERESKRDSALIQEFARMGWQLKVVTTQERLLELHDECDVYCFRHPAGPNPVRPVGYWKERLAPAVREGALALFASYGHIPLDQYFDDPSFKVRLVALYDVPLAGRRTQLIAPGEWGSKPNDLRPALKRGVTPAYGFVPADADAWTVLATAPSADGGTVPYLLTRRHGKGLIVLCSDSIHRVSASKLFENLALFHQSHRSSLP